MDALQTAPETIALPAGNVYALVGWLQDAYGLLGDLKNAIPEGNEQNDLFLTRIARSMARAVEMMPELEGGSAQTTEEVLMEQTVEPSEQPQLTDTHFAHALAVALELAELFVIHNGEPVSAGFQNEATDTIERLRAILPEDALAAAREHAEAWEAEGWPS